MKRLISIILVLLLILSSLSAISYTSFYSLSLSRVGTKVKDDEIMRSSYAIGIEAEPLGLAMGRHSISMPLSASYVSSSPVYKYYALNSHFDFGIGLSYRYSFTELFTLKVKGSLLYRYYSEVRASIMTGSASSALEFYAGRKAALTVPLEVHFTKDELLFSVGLGCLIKVGGER